MSQPGRRRRAFQIPYPNLERRYCYPKPFGNGKLLAWLLRYSKHGLEKKVAQLTSQEIRTSKVYSDAVGDTCRSRVIWIS